MRMAVSELFLCPGSAGAQQSYLVILRSSCEHFVTVRVVEKEHFPSRGRFDSTVLAIVRAVKAGGPLRILRLAKPGAGK